MSLKKLPVEIEVDKACDRFIEECRKRGNKVSLPELIRLIKHSLLLYLEDSMKTAMDRFEDRIKILYWLLGILITLVIALIGIIFAKF